MLHVYARKKRPITCDRILRVVGRCGETAEDAMTWLTPGTTVAQDREPAKLGFAQRLEGAILRVLKDSETSARPAAQHAAALSPQTPENDKLNLDQIVVRSPLG